MLPPLFFLGLVLAFFLLKRWRWLRSDIKRVPVPVKWNSVSGVLTVFTEFQGGASFVWGHDRQVYEQDVGEAYRKWHDAHGNVIRVRAAYWVRNLQFSSLTEITSHARPFSIHR